MKKMVGGLFLWWFVMSSGDPSAPLFYVGGFVDQAACTHAEFWGGQNGKVIVPCHERR
jgi:hypothetical protein